MSSRDDIFGYLVGELAGEERAAFERRMADDRELADEVRRLAPVVEELQALPGEAWSDDPLPDLAALPPRHERAPDASLRRRHRPAVLAACAAALAALVATAVVIVTLAGSSGGDARRIDLARVGAADAGASGTASVPSSSDGTLRLRLRGMDPSPVGRFYEVWLLDSPERMVSLGSFRVPESGKIDVTLPLPVPVTDFQFIDISVEPEDGVAAHSGDSVMRAPTSS